jgi:hypothetical protein
VAGYGQGEPLRGSHDRATARACIERVSWVITTLSACPEP